ncbi:MAG: D-2-hydroxyacid dehydrogenase [Bacteroidota bacterium]
MNIVILDAKTVNHGDLSWAGLEALGSLMVYDRSAEHEVLERSLEADAILTNKAIISAETLAQLPRLKYIGIIATGYNSVDTEFARTRGIPVCNAAGYGTDSVAQHVFALILSLSNHVAAHAKSTSEGVWTRSPDWTYTLAPMFELAGKTLGIIGLGTIGRRVAELGLAFGMKVIAQNRSPRSISGVEMVDVDSIFAQSDVISLHTALTAENAAFVNAARIGLMKSSAILINTARGGLIQEDDLAGALNEGRIAGAGLDVLSSEPPPLSNPLLSAKNCLVTPHNAWQSREARSRLIEIVVENLVAFLRGEPQNVVNGV